MTIKTPPLNTRTRPDLPPTPSFICSSCERGFTEKEHLQDHERIHNNSRPFSCQMCDKSFARQDTLHRHVRKHNKYVVPNFERQAACVGGGNSDLLTSAYGHSQDESLVAIKSPSSPALDQSTSIARSLSISTNPATCELASKDLSSLFWPNLENLVQTLKSLRPNLGDFSGPWTVLVEDSTDISQPGKVDSQAGSCYKVETSVDEGHQAVQTLNGLVDNSLHRLPSPTILSHMTQRFLDECLHSFFTMFLPTFPVIHEPTLEVRDCSPPLLLNMIALGSVFLGTSDASEKGEALWRIAHDAVAKSWHVMITQRRPYDLCKGVELILTAVLSQIYVTLSQNKMLRMTSQKFHGLITDWARCCYMYDLPMSTELSSPASTTKDHTWKVWSASESQLRALIGLYIIDGVASTFNGSSSFASHLSNPLPLTSNRAAFECKSAESWVRAIERPRVPSIRYCDLIQSFFTDPLTVYFELSLLDVKVILEAISSLVKESAKVQPLPHGLPSILEILHVLDRLRFHIFNNNNLSSTERSISLLRWHDICLNIVYNTAQGARRLCHRFDISQSIYEGETQEESDFNPSQWVTERGSRKSLLHASQIQAIVEELPLGLAYDLHNPGALFAAATVFTELALAGVTKVAVPVEIDWQTVLFDEAPGFMNPSAFEPTKESAISFINAAWNQCSEGNSTRNLVHDLKTNQNLLRSLSVQWGVTKEMRKIVAAWIAHCG